MSTVKKLSFLGLLLIFVIFGISVCSGAPIASGSSYSITLAQYQTIPETNYYRNAEYFKKRVGELSDGRITINHFPGDLLGGWEIQSVHVKEGSLDMCIMSITPTFDPETEVFRMPYLVFNWEGAKKVFGPDGGGAKFLSEMCERNNTHSLGFDPTGFVVVLSKKQITPLPGDESIKKIKSRVLSSKLEEMIGRTFGFSTLSLPFAEVNSALMLGTIDAAMGPTYEEAPLFKDTIKYQYNYDYGFAGGPWIINGDLWKSLPAEDQEILETAMREAIDASWEISISNQEKVVAEMREAGVQVVDLTKEQMAANVRAIRDTVWSWASENMFSEELMNKIRSFAQPVID